MENAQKKEVNVVKSEEIEQKTDEEIVVNKAIDESVCSNSSELSIDSSNESLTEVIDPTKNKEKEEISDKVELTSETELDLPKGNDKQPTKTKKAKATKSNKPTKTHSKRKPVGTGGFIAICCSLSVVCALLGGIGGYFLYQQIKPEETYTSSYSDFLTLRERANKNPNLLEEFEGEEYNIVNVALDKYCQHKHTLTMGYGEAFTKANGTQTVKAVTIGGHDKAYNQNISYTGPDAKFKVSTAFRFYYDTTDAKNPKIEAYEKKKPEDWTADMPADNNYNPNDFMKKYGKLNYGEYIVDSEGKFVTLGTDGEGKIINGVSIYQINSNSVAKCETPRKNSSGNYEFNLTLLAKSACTYYAKQIKTNGGSNKNPRFTEFLDITFELNDDFELVSSYVKEEYEITVGVTANCNSTMKQMYFFSDEDTHVVNGTEIKIPEKGEQFVLEMDKDGNISKTESK